MARIKARTKANFVFRVTESEVVDPERVARGLALWAGYLARHLPDLRLAAKDRAAQAESDEK